MIKVKVMSELQSVMFTAELSDAWVHILTMRDQVKPYIKSSVKVQAGTGNAGNELEYQCEYDGHYVYWEHFAAVGNEAN